MIERSIYTILYGGALLSANVFMKDNSYWCIDRQVLLPVDQHYLFVSNVFWGSQIFWTSGVVKSEMDVFFLFSKWPLSAAVITGTSSIFLKPTLETHVSDYLNSFVKTFKKCRKI